MLIFKSQIEAKAAQQEQKVSKMMDSLAVLNNRVTQFALGGGVGGAIPIASSGTLSPDVDQRLLEYERKVN